jgi:hypothetical protein
MQSFEDLDLAFVALGRFAAEKGSQVPPPARPRG